LNNNGALPPGFVFQGHQFLSNAIALSDTYEKTGPPNKGGPFSTQFGQNAFPAARDCDFHVLSPTCVQIVPHDGQKSSIEACLENGRWRLDVGNRWLKASSVKHA